MIQAMQMFDSQSQAQKILVEQVNILYRTLIPILAVNLVVSSALLYGLWEVVPQVTLIVWMSLMLLVLVIRVVNFLTYRYYFKPEFVNRHGLYFVLGGGVTGLLWGVGGVILFPEHNLEYQLFILCVLVGLGAGSLSSLTTYLPAFFAYFPTSMIPICVKLISIDDPIHLSLGIMTLAYIVALSYFGININRTLVQSLKLRFENIDLVKQLRQQKDEAEQANTSKTKFLAAASHDLRQPLHALTLFTSVLDESIQYPKVRRVVDQIKASVQALQSLFNALLDISRLEAGVMKVEKTDFALQPLFEKLANDFNPEASEKGLNIHWADCTFAVHSDPALIEQILRNYISNAIRYTDSGEVRITCDNDEDQLKINIIDSGAGIPEEEREAIFQEFHQLGNPERDRSKGLGLGLAIVQRTAKLLGHPIEVKSKRGAGSTFSITVDRVEMAEQVTETAPKVDNSVQPPDRLLIIVIDDEASVREGTQTLLATWGCEVICAADKEDAMTRVKEINRVPDGIIADYSLRENQTGIEAIHAMQKTYKADIPAIIVTGDTAAERLREANSSGFQVLHKPVAPAKLRTFLRNVQLRKKKPAGTNETGSMN